MRILYGVLFVSSCLVGHFEGAVNFKAAREGHRATAMSQNGIHTLAELETTADFKKILDPIMVPRVVGTESHEKVKKYLVGTMQNLGWQVEVDEFSSNTPIGRLTFGNVVARLNPGAERFLTLACHYDSKYMREGSFIGATDSAVPCAMMLHLATTMDEYLKKNAQTQSAVSLKLIFFDGEEAFNQWGPNDSIYGAKNLAKKLEKTPYPAGSRDLKSNDLQRMDMLVLLDLIGVADPSFYSYFTKTDKWYKRLVNAEDKLAEMRLLEKYTYGMDGYPNHRYFNPQSVYAGIEDDHIPFLRRDVPILHLIPSPFPKEWHKESDNYAALDFNTIANLNKIMRIFVAEYLSLKIE